MCPHELPLVASIVDEYALAAELPYPGKWKSGVNLHDTGHSDV
jgi:hypothetical protein